MNDVTMTDTTPRERRHRRTRDAILQAAVEMIREKGADKLSLRAIARKIDYSPAGLYEYFGSKEEIIEAVCTRANAYLNRYLRGVSTDLALDDYLIELGLAYVRYARENPEMFTMMFTNMSGPEGSFTVDDMSDEDAFSVVVKAIQSGMESGEIASGGGLDAFSISYGLWAVVHGMAVLQVTYLDALHIDFERADRYTLRVFVDGLLKRK